MEAFNRGDMDTFAASISDDVIWHAPGKNRYSGTFDGKAAALGRFREQAQGGVKFSFADLHDVVGNDEHVVALLTIKVSGPGGDASTRSAFVMHVRDGKMTEFWAFNEDQAAVDAAVGA
jgi:ketosteroid isomerase-like protein